MQHYLTFLSTPLSDAAYPVTYLVSDIRSTFYNPISDILKLSIPYETLHGAKIIPLMEADTSSIGYHNDFFHQNIYPTSDISELPTRYETQPDVPKHTPVGRGVPPQQVLGELFHVFG